VSLADVDGDGDQDVLSASSGDDKVAWYENRIGESSSDSDGFGPQQTISTSATSAASVRTADLDKDGDQDVLASSDAFRNKLAWYENRIGEDGADSDGFGTPQTISTSAVKADVVTADLDGDKDQDILVTYGADFIVAWYENQIGEEGADSDGFGTEQSIDSGSGPSGRTIQATDLDGDGDQDVLSGTSGIGWYENQIGESGTGNGGFSNRLDITVNSFAIAADDLDGDGDADLLSGNTERGFVGENKVAWYENQIGESGGARDGFGTETTVSTNLDGSPSIALADLDNDGDRDIISATFTDGKVAWYENDFSSVVASQSASISSNGNTDFGGTGIDLDFSSINNAGRVTVSTFGSAPANTSGISESNVSQYRFEIETDGGLRFTDAQVRVDVSSISGVSNPDNVTIYKRDTPGSGSFDPLTTNVDDGGTSGDEIYATVSEFSEFVLASNTEPLPVEMAGLNARLANGAVQLSWQTASETNNAGFRVQRKASVKPSRRDGSTLSSKSGEKSWTRIGSVEGAGTTSEAQSYRFTDADLPYEANALTYRLKQVDTDGTAHVSETVTVERSVDEVQLLGTFPNPTRQQATVRYALPDRHEVEMQLYDVLGRQVRTVVSDQKEGRHGRTLDVGSLSSGVYFLRLQAGGEVRTQKLTVVR
jgi:hypothetical protein